MLTEAKLSQPSGMREVEAKETRVRTPRCEDRKVALSASESVTHCCLACIPDQQRSRRSAEAKRNQRTCFMHLLYMYSMGAFNLDGNIAEPSETS